MVDFTYNFHFGYCNGTRFRYWLFSAHFVYKRSVGQIWVKVTE